ncbi:MAG: UDPglucose--hexose-phosphate uridylyltransferase [Thermotogaceae bacterium]|nr:UDPglucose--hexose-phosphate uridylyltransferase [Thermotogaceae bacterium]MDN5337275.1 UDPglucose--hexose-phosphate uridylyltransferase [Thermotogaceae bacterium]
MLETRYNPLTDEWVMVSSSRSARPVLPSENACPLCPGVLELEKDYDLATFENRFPALKVDAPDVVQESELLKKIKSKGVCEVVMYTSEHDSALPRMSLNQIEKLIFVWRDRTFEISRNDFIKYIFLFENRGKEVGATLSHPHGQLYAFPFLPKRIQVKVNSMRGYYHKNKKCVLCDIVEEEIEKNERIIYQNESFIAIVPFYARFPYEVHIYPKRHVTSVLDLVNKEIEDFARALKVVTMKYDKLFDQEFPYMMCFFQKPFNLNEVFDDFFHFHVEFYPPKRDKDKIKWMASVETGTWNFINPSLPKEVADRLKSIEVNLDD